MIRVGWGVDAHQFGDEPPLILGGVEVSSELGLDGTSDADVATHALIDALLGAAALGDIGMHFPPGDPSSQGADSVDMLRTVVALVRDAGFRPYNVDVTIVAQSVKVAPFREAMRGRLAAALDVGVGQVSVKATTTDRMGFIGRDEGVAAMAVATIVPLSDG